LNDNSDRRESPTPPEIQTSGSSRKPVETG
jgi:hypothetical protein